MEFLYRYYYTFFLLHKKDVDVGRIKDPAWQSALLQVTAGVGMLSFGIAILTFAIFGGSDYLRGIGKFLAIFFIGYRSIRSGCRNYDFGSSKPCGYNYWRGSIIWLGTY